MSSDKKPKIPDAPTPPAGHGNLLSSVAPPSQLPNFITAIPPPTNSPSDVHIKSATTNPVPVQPILVQHKSEPQLGAEKFSPAIPLSKGEPLVSIRTPDDSQTTSESLHEAIPDLDQIGDVMPGSGILTWMKGAVSSSSILQRVAEKAKSSVDSMITTLDPQMKEYLKSGGDIYLVVASDKEVKISPVREAFQTVFGKATVIGYEAVCDVTASQPVGYAAAYAAAKQRIAHIRSSHTDINNNIPVVAIESFLLEAVPDRWYDVALLVFSQPSLGIELQIQSQGTPVPAAAVSAAKAATPSDYEHTQTGYSVTIGSIMGASLQVGHTHWQEESTGVCRREVLALAARSLAGSYKKLLAISAAET